MRPVQAPVSDPDTLSTTPLPARGAPVLPPGAAACERVTSLFGAFRDGALPELLRTGIARHLDACATCRLRADDYREVIRLAGSLPPITPPPAVAARLLATIRAAAARPATGELDDTRPDILIP